MKAGQKVALVLGVTAIFALVAGRYFLFTQGVLYTQSDDRWSNWVVVGVASLIAVSLVHSSSKQTGTERVVIISGVAAFLSAAIGIGALVAPTTPRDATAPSCAGAAVAGGHFLATTSPLGANARSGPDESFPQVRRFAAGCTLSFDGYCIGQPEKDLLLGKPKWGNLEDDRWLILHQATLGSLLGFDHPRPIFVASGVVQSQSAEEALGREPDRVCAKSGGWAPPGRVSFTVRQSKDGSLHLAASASRAVVIGFGVILVGKTGGDAIHRLSSRQVPFNVSDGTSASARIARSDALAPSGPTQLVAAVCLAPNVEQPNNYQVVQVAAPIHGRFVITPLGRPLRGEERARAQIAACSSA